MGTPLVPYLHYDTIVRMAVRALQDGAERHSPTTIRWNIAGSCKDPVGVSFFGRPEAKKGRDIRVAPGTSHPLEIIMDTPCRKCPPCLRYRSWLWSLRGKAEIGMAPRTWFGTLTLRPEWRFHALTVARHTAQQRGLDFESLPPEEQFLRKCRVIARQITLWLKRIRKESGTKFRYLIVAERHEDGEPHWHLLLHETRADQPVKYRVLKEQWYLGHAQFKLAASEHAAYVCKYLTKDNEARVRASLRYGEERSLNIGSRTNRTTDTVSPRPQQLTTPPNHPQATGL